MASRSISTATGAWSESAGRHSIRTSPSWRSIATATARSPAARARGGAWCGDHPRAGADTGVRALRERSGGEAGWIDATSPFWSKRLLWTDPNHDGISPPAELQPVGNVLTKIGLGYSMGLRTD